MRFKDVKVAYKILVLVVIAGIAMAMIGYTGYSSLQSAGADLDNMYTRKLTAVRLLGDEINNMRIVQVNTIRAVLEPGEAAELKSARDAAMEDYEQKWQDYRKLAVMLPEVGAQMPEAEEDWQSYKKSMEGAMGLAVAGKKEEAWKVYNEAAAPAFKKLSSKLFSLQKIANDNAEKINAEMADNNKKAVFSMAAKTVGALVLLLLIGLWLIREITTALQVMVAACGRMRDGDFRMEERRVERRDEFGVMADEMEGMRTSLNALMKKISTSAEQLAASSEELTANSTQSAQSSMQVAQSAAGVSVSVEKQQTAVGNSNASVAKVRTSVGSIREKSVQVAEHSAAVAARAAAGSEAIDASVSQMKSVETTVNASAKLVDKLGERSVEIGEIVETISAIADQTNLLALNAAIEAARAGEHGRGFTVVSEEVRKLAGESQLSAEKINDLITGIQKDTASAVAAMKDGQQAVVEGAQSVEALRAMFEEIRDLVRGVSEQIQSVTGEINGVATDSDYITQEVGAISEYSGQVASEMQSVSAATEEQSASAQEIAAASDALAKLAQEQQLALQHFQF